jgi:uncharacterized zinc-type alcohol dehydrogenase-like protein
MVFIFVWSSSNLRHAHFSLIGGRRSLVPEWWITRNTRKLDYCAEHNIVSDIEMIDIKTFMMPISEWKSDVRYRFVIDMATL